MGGPPTGSGRAYRLDPTYPRVQPAAAPGGRAFGLDLTRGAVVFGEDGQIAVPFAAYRGVAVRMEPVRTPGNVRVTLELLHSDRTLTVPLAVADDPDGVAADWQQWGRVLKLPLLVVAMDGSVSAPLANLGTLVIYPPKLRRRPSHFTARRPRFLVRRKVGRRGPPECLAGREIIARN